MNYRTVAFTNVIVIFASTLLLTVAITTNAWILGKGEIDLGEFMARLTHTNTSSPVLVTFVDIFRGLTVRQGYRYGLGKICYETIFSTTTSKEPAAMKDMLVSNIDDCQDMGDVITMIGKYSEKLGNDFKNYHTIYICLVAAVICNVFAVIASILKSPFVKIAYSKLLVTVTTIMCLITGSCVFTGIMLFITQRGKMKDYLEFSDAVNTGSNDAMTRNILRSFDFEYDWSSGYSFYVVCASEAMLVLGILQNIIEYILRNKESADTKEAPSKDKAREILKDQNRNRLLNKQMKSLV